MEPKAHKEAHMYMDIWFVTKITLKFSREGTVFAVDSAGVTGYAAEGEEMWCQFPIRQLQVGINQNMKISL